MKKFFLILCFLFIALLLLPGVFANYGGWGESLEIGGTVKVAEEPENEGDLDSEQNAEQQQENKSESNTKRNPPVVLHGPNSSSDYHTWTVEINLD